MTEKENDMIRINVRISREIKDWIDDCSKKTGLSQSVIGLLALEQYMQQKQAFQKMDQLEKLNQEVNLLKSIIGEATKDM